MRIVLIGLLLFIVSMASGQNKIIPDSSYANGYYVSRLNFFEKLPNSKKEIVFLGNSITEVGEFSEIITKGKVVNRGISGDNSYGVYARLYEVLASKPEKIFIMIGVNDIKRGTPLENIASNYKRIIKKIKKESPKTQVYMQSVLPVNEGIMASIYDLIENKKIDALNNQLKIICDNNKVTYVNLNGDVFKDENGQIPENLTTDGLHLKPASYILWVDYLYKKNYL